MEAQARKNNVRPCLPKNGQPVTVGTKVANMKKHLPVQHCRPSVGRRPPGPHTNQKITPVTGKRRTRSRTGCTHLHCAWVRRLARRSACCPNGVQSSRCAMSRRENRLPNRCHRTAVGHFRFRFYVAGGVLVAPVPPSPVAVVVPDGACACASRATFDQR